MTDSIRSLTESKRSFTYIIRSFAEKSSIFYLERSSKISWSFIFCEMTVYFTFHPFSKVLGKKVWIQPKVETLFKTCVCDTSYKPTTYPITSLTTTKSETDLSCVGCATLVAAKDTQKYNGITMANFLSDDTTTSCAFKSNLFQPTGTGTEFRWDIFRLGGIRKELKWDLRWSWSKGEIEVNCGWVKLGFQWNLG